MNYVLVSTSMKKHLPRSLVPTRANGPTVSANVDWGESY